MYRKSHVSGFYYPIPLVAERVEEQTTFTFQKIQKRTCLFRWLLNLESPETQLEAEICKLPAWIWTRTVKKKCCVTVICLALSLINELVEFLICRRIKESVDCKVSKSLLLTVPYWFSLYNWVPSVADSRAWGRKQLMFIALMGLVDMLRFRWEYLHVTNPGALARFGEPLVYHRIYFRAGSRRCYCALW